MELFKTTWKMLKGLENWIMECVIFVQSWSLKNATRTTR
jgi:hypothetical protein